MKDTTPWIEISKLQPHPDNPREHTEEQIKKIARSIKELDWGRPIIISSDNYILAGHGAYLAAKDELKLTEVPYRRMQWKHDSPEALAYMVADNKLTDESDWNYGQLQTLNENIELQGFDVELTGFDDVELKTIETQATNKKEITEDDFNPDDLKNEEPVAKKRNIWKLGRHRLMCGDSTNIEDVKLLMGGGQIDLIFTDPPYSVNYEKKTKEIFKNKDYTKITNDDLSVDEIASKIWKPSFKNMHEVASDKCSFYITAPQGGDHMMMMMMMMKENWQLKHELIWVKNSPVFSMGRLDYDYQHEPILYGWKKTHRFYGEGSFTKSVWHIGKNKENKLHPTMKPIELISNALLNSTLKDENVLDPFGGSGSTLIACEQLERNCFMMEIDPHYCDVIIKRWEEFTGNKAELIKNS